MATREHWFVIEAAYMHGWTPYKDAEPRYDRLHLAQEAKDKLQHRTSFDLRIVKVSPLYDVEVVE